MHVATSAFSQQRKKPKDNGRRSRSEVVGMSTLTGIYTGGRHVPEEKKGYAELVAVVADAEDVPSSILDILPVE